MFQKIFECQRWCRFFMLLCRSVNASLLNMQNIRQWIVCFIIQNWNIEQSTSSFNRSVCDDSHQVNKIENNTSGRWVAIHEISSEQFHSLLFTVITKSVITSFSTDFTLYWRLHLFPIISTHLAMKLHQWKKGH